MEELTLFIESIERVGLPLLLSILVIYIIYLCSKNIPKYFDQRAEQHKEQQEYYKQRQLMYEEQMSIIIRVAEQGNSMIGQSTQVIAQSNEVIRMNTEAIKNNSMIHSRVITALGNDLEALRILAQDLKEHDSRAERISNEMREVVTILKVKEGVSI